MGEPARGGPSEADGIQVLPAGPGHDAVGPHEYGGEAEVVACRTGRVPDPAFPPLGRALQRAVAAEVQQDAPALAQQVTQAGAVLEAEVGGGATDEQVTVAQVVAVEQARRAAVPQLRAVDRLTHSYSRKTAQPPRSSSQNTNAAASLPDCGATAVALSGSCGE